MGVSAEPQSLAVAGAGLASPVIEKARSALLPPQDVEDTVETLMVSSWGRGSGNCLVLLEHSSSRTFWRCRLRAVRQPGPPLSGRLPGPASPRAAAAAAASASAAREGHAPSVRLAARPGAGLPLAEAGAGRGGVSAAWAGPRRP